MTADEILASSHIHRVEPLKRYEDQLLAYAALQPVSMARANGKTTESLKKLIDKLDGFRAIGCIDEMHEWPTKVEPVTINIQTDIIQETINQIEKEKINMAGFKFGGMSRFERQMREKQAMEEKKRAEEEAAKKAEEEEAKKAEEWIWVEGYKGTNKDMTCRDYQFELNKQFDMPEGAPIEDCESGFHFCRDLKDVFAYYSIDEGRRFFRVRALVRKKDYEEYGVKPASSRNPYANMFAFLNPIRDKLAAKSIQFLYELTPDEVFAPYCDHDKEIRTWSTESKRLAMEHGIKYVKNIERVNTLVSLGYSEAFTQYLVDHNMYEKAYAVGTKKDLSMDMKVLMILKG